MSDGKTVRWGLLGCGGIASDFANAVSLIDNAQVTACGARRPNAAVTFGAKFGVPETSCYTGYDGVSTDANVDAVYVNAIHPLHYSQVKQALEHGKHVLVEKPFTVTAQQTQELIALAAEKKLFLMEAMWTRYFPATTYLQELLDSKAIGPITALQATFGFKCPDNVARIWNNDQAGGGLLDIGIYPIAFASFLFGPQAPTTITASATLTEGKVDSNGDIVLKYGQQTANLSYTLLADVDETWTITGDTGTITVGPNAHCPTVVTVQKTGDAEPTKKTFPLPAHTVTFNYPNSEGLAYEAAAASQYILDGKLQSDKQPLAESLTIMQTLDAVRTQIGLVYAEDSAPQ